MQEAPSNTSTPESADLRSLASRFAVDPPVREVRPLGKGLINETFSVSAGGGHYVLQRINARVFPYPEQIMANLRALCGHAARHPDAGIRIPALIPTRNGDAFLRATDGGIWRLMEMIPDAVTLTRIETSMQAHETGRALGRFHGLVGSLPPERLGLSLPGFHRTPRYLDRLFTALEPGDRAAHSDSVRACVSFVRARTGLAEVLESARDSGRIRVRVTHGDPKIDNILFSRADGRALALIDLDTVQPGLIQHDLGDCLRSACNRRGEDARGEEAVRFDLNVCRGIVAGYAEATRGRLTDDDTALLYDAVRLMPFELGVRFLTDHLEGDRYFRVREPGENLRKAGVQFALVEDIERNEHRIRGIITDCFARA